MHDQFANPLYSSASWKRTRKQYALSKGGLCERCLRRGVITAGTQVHHKIHLTPTNWRDPKIALNPANLELLCDACHAAEHSTAETPRWSVDASGRVTI